MSHFHNPGASLLLLMLVLVSCARPETETGTYFHEYETFDLSRKAAYSDYEAVVGSYLRAHSLRPRTQACVVGLTRGDRDSEMAWVVWREGGRIIRWFAGENDLHLSSRNLSLDTDVVASDEDIGSSTYQVSRPWVEALETLCDTDGETVAI